MGKVDFWAIFELSEADLDPKECSDLKNIGTIRSADSFYDIWKKFQVNRFCRLGAKFQNPGSDPTPPPPYPDGGSEIGYPDEALTGLAN